MQSELLKCLRASSRQHTPWGKASLPLLNCFFRQLSSPPSRGLQHSHSCCQKVAACACAAAADSRDYATYMLITLALCKNFNCKKWKSNANTHTYTHTQRYTLTLSIRHGVRSWIVLTLRARFVFVCGDVGDDDDASWIPDTLPQIYEPRTRKATKREASAASTLILPQQWQQQPRQKQQCNTHTLRHETTPRAATMRHAASYTRLLHVCVRTLHVSVSISTICSYLYVNMRHM